MKTKKELKQEYKSMKFRQGIFQIRNIKEDRILLQTTSDLDRAYNADLFQLKSGLHGNKMLQNDWDTLGPQAFEFKIFDELKIKDTASPLEVRRELKLFLDMNLAELKTNGQLLY